MSTEDKNDQLPPDVQAFFDAERDRPPLAPEAVRALREATEATLRQQASSAEVPRRAFGVGAGLAVGLGLGLAIGAGAVIALRPTPAPREQRVIETRIEVREVFVTSDAGSPDAGVTLPDAGTRTPSVDARPRAASGGDALAREQLLLQRARSALLHQDGEAALEGVRLHSRPFPTGALVEEREALRVDALMLLQRTAEARARAADFHRRWPGSLLGDMVDHALSSAAPTG